MNNPNSFVLVDLPGRRGVVRGLPISEGGQAMVESGLRAALPSYLSDDLSRIPFDPAFKPDEETVFSIPNFQLPPEIAAAVENPREVTPLSRSEQVRTARGVFHAEPASGLIAFQSSRRVDLLRRDRVWLFMEGGTFTTDDRDALSLDPAVDAVYEGDGTLLFRSTRAVGGMLDLARYVTEATREDVEVLASHELIDGDASTIFQKASPTAKRKIRLLVKSGVLDRLSVEDIAEKAAEVDVTVPMAGGRVLLPEKNSELSALLDFLTSGVFRGLFDGQVYATNSKRLV